MRKLLSMIFNMVVCLTILVSLSYLISAEQTKDNPHHVPSVLGFAPLTVVSGSMSPGIETGDMVIIKLGNQKIKSGDIITYRLDDMLITHRVKSISGQKLAAAFVTQGDANSVPDYEMVGSNQIVGKYICKIPMGGYIKASLRGLPGVLILLGLVLIVVMQEVLHRTKLRVNEVQNSVIN